MVAAAAVTEEEGMEVAMGTHPGPVVSLLGGSSSTLCGVPDMAELCRRPP